MSILNSIYFKFNLQEKSPLCSKAEGAKVSGRDSVHPRVEFLSFSSLTWGTFDIRVTLHAVKGMTQSLGIKYKDRNRLGATRCFDVAEDDPILAGESVEDEHLHHNPVEGFVEVIFTTFRLSPEQ